MPIARLHNILDWILCSPQECEGIRGLVWTIEMQSCETDCRICCLANQTLRVRGLNVKELAKANIGCHLFPLRSFCHTLQQLTMWIGFTCCVIPPTPVWFCKVLGSHTVNQSQVISFYRFCLNFCQQAPQSEIVKALMVLNEKFNLNAMQSVAYFPKQSYSWKKEKK